MAEESIRVAPGSWTPTRVGRTAAILDILCSVPSGYSVSVLTKVFVRDDASATAANVLRFESAFRAGMVAEICGLALFAAMIVLVYGLFKPVGHRTARVFLVLAIMGATIQAVDVLADVGALSLAKGGADAQALVYLGLKMHSFAYTVALAFMGCGFLCLAVLVARARFLPRFIGWIYPIEGLGILTFSFATLLAPAVAARLRPFLPFGTALVGEAALMFWLLIRGVDEKRWYEQSDRS